MRYILMRLFDIEVITEERKLLLKHRCLTRCLFLLVHSFRNFYIEIGCVQGCKTTRLRCDKFPLFDVNMAGISTGGYPRGDETCGPLGWKMPMGTTF